MEVKFGLNTKCFVIETPLFLVFTDLRNTPLQYIVMGWGKRGAPPYLLELHSQKIIAQNR